MAAIPELRSKERLRHHYDIEVALASRLKSAPKQQRRALYTEVYDSLFKEVPDHPQHTVKASGSVRDEQARGEVARFERFIDSKDAYLEIGPGDCRVAFEMCRRARKVYAVDVSAEISKSAGVPENFELIISDGTSIPVPPASVNFAYSNQLIEHLHPDDAIEQLKNVHAALAPGGRYLCITPSRISGPHDISQYFDPVARGLHLREYDARQLGRLMKLAGFTRCDVLVGTKRKFLVVPLSVFGWIEGAIALLPRALARRRLLNGLLNVKLLATK